MLCMAETLTQEMHYIHQRMKQKLLYQIGLIDDPWRETNDFIEDDLYSQD